MSKWLRTAGALADAASSASLDPEIRAAVVQARAAAGSSALPGCACAPPTTQWGQVFHLSLFPGSGLSLHHLVHLETWDRAMRDLTPGKVKDERPDPKRLKRLKRLDLTPRG